MKQIIPCTIKMYAKFKEIDTGEISRDPVVAFGIDDLGYIRAFIADGERGISDDHELCCNFIGYDWEE